MIFKLPISSLFLLLFNSILIFANLGNEWIDYDKDYYKFQSDYQGLIRIDFESLVTAGIDLNGADFKIFTSGKQIPIFVKTDGLFSSGDYIEFFARPNDGELDQLLFEQESDHANPEKSLFDDARVYFLVSDQTGEHLRINNVSNETDGPLPSKEEFFYYTSRNNLFTSFHSGEPHLFANTQSFPGDFTTGEGWLSSIINSSFDFNVKVPTPEIYLPELEEENVEIFSRLVGRNHSIGVIKDKEIEISINEQAYIHDKFNRYSIADFSFNVRPSELETEPDFSGIPQTRLVYKGFDGSVGAWSYNTSFSIAYVYIKYPRTFNFENQSSFLFDLDLMEDRYIEIENFNQDGNLVLYNLDSKKRIIPTIENNLLQFHLPAELNGLDFERQFYLCNTEEELLNIETFEKINFTNFLLENQQADFIILSEDGLINDQSDVLKGYAAYRSSDLGGNHKAKVFSINEMYDQFAWGIDKHPLAIKNFLSMAIEEWDIEPEYLLLVGKSISYDAYRFLPELKEQCLVPSFGNVPSDCILSSPNSTDYRPRLATGRLPVQSVDQLIAYFNKLKEYEQVFNDAACDPESRRWMRSALHIAKGWGADQTVSFQDNLDEYIPLIQNPPAEMILSNTLNDDYGQPDLGQEETFYPSPQFTDEMENGINLINYFGHGIGNYWQFDINPDPSVYSNQGKYPFILSNACSVGQIHQTPGNETMVEDYVLAPEAGAIGFLASTALSSALYVDLFSTNLLENLMDVHYGESIAKSIQQTVHDLYIPNDDGIRKVCTEFVYVGDPAVKLYQWDQAELFMPSNTFEIGPDTLSYETENINISFSAQNMGKGLSNPISVGLYQTDSLGNEQLVWSDLITPSIDLESYQRSIPLPASNRFEGESKFTIYLDFLNEQNEKCEDDNFLFREIYLKACTIDCPIDTMAIDTMMVDTIMTDTNVTALQILQESTILSIYPNPAQQFVHFQCSTPMQIIRIRNAEGTVLKQVAFEMGKNHWINLNNFKPGTYFAEILTDIKTFNRKIVVIR